MHRMPGKSRLIYDRRVHSSVGDLQSCVPLSLHIKVVKDSSSVPPGQQRLGVPEVRAVEIKFDWNADRNNVADSKIYEDILIFNSLHRRRRFLEYSSSLIISSGVEVTIYPFIGFLY